MADSYDLNLIRSLIEGRLLTCAQDLSGELTKSPRFCGACSLSREATLHKRKHIVKLIISATKGKNWIIRGRRRASPLGLATGEGPF